MQEFNMVRDVSGFNSFGLIPSDNVYNTKLAATVAQTFTVPSTANNWIAIFMMEPGATVWCAHNTTATLPGVSVATSPGELNPTVWKVAAGDTISCITNDTLIEMGIKFYAI